MIVPGPEVSEHGKEPGVPPPNAVAPDLRSLRQWAIINVAAFLAVNALGLLLVAGTLAYWEAWLYLGIISALMLGAVRWLYVHDPGLLARRKRFKLGPGARWAPSLILFVSVILIFLVPALDRRFGWSQVPVALVLASDLLVVAGYLVIMAAFKANSYAAAAVVVEEGQTVAAAGPYAFVRHPMYLGSIITYGFTPLALGSLWGLVPGILLPLALVLRIRDEEKYLLQNLPGYHEYTVKTRYRLLPGIW